MIYVDTDFIMALAKERDWLQERAERLLEKHKGKIWMSETTLTELLLLAAKYSLDAEKLISAALGIAMLKGEAKVFLLAAHYMKEGAGVFDALHAARCGKESKIISSDKIFDKLGLRRIKLEAA